METQSVIPSFEDKKLHSADKTAHKLFKQLESEIEAIKNLANPDLCEAKYLPFLAYAFKAEFWDEDLSEDEKRALVKKSLALHRHKGTIWALEQVFKALKIEAEVFEWFDYAGEPYHFKIDLSLTDKEITPALIKNLRKFVKNYKNVRSILDELILSYLQSQNIKVAAGAVGESKCYVDMVEGYKESLSGFQTICVGAVGESKCYVDMVDGYKEISKALLSATLGGVGEVESYAKMEEMSWQ